MLIKEDDELFVHFFIIAFLEYHNEEIISVDYSQIPSVLSQLCIKSINEVDIIFDRAKKIRSQTPFSFRLMARKLEIFKPKSTRLKELFNFYEPETMNLLPILPSEVFHIAYSNIVNCPDSDCRNFKVAYDDEGEMYSEKREYEESKSNKMCYFCERKNEHNEINSKTVEEIPISYILIDLRVSDEKDNDKHYDVKPGFLPMTVILDQSELNDENVILYK
jgi:hypothetical protein